VIRCRYLLPLMVAMLAGVASAEDKADTMAIVVNKKSGLESVSSSELAKIFKAEKRKDPAGFKFIVVMREPGSRERSTALSQIYRMNENEYSRYFLQAVFTGAIPSAPRQLNSAAAVKQFVTENPGAIGYLRASDQDDSVKSLRIDGKLPDEPGYQITMQ
jgi:ABC-type phosphate transport system substrate-binding protein